MAITFAVESWKVFGQMAPYLLFGFLMAGMLSVWLSPKWVERHLGGRGFGPVLKASMLGVPLPLCSCSVIPVSAAMHRQGASRSATTAFLISTPQMGVDSIAATYAMLGPVYAVFRPITAFLSGLIGGTLVRVFDADKNDPPARAVSPTNVNACHPATAAPSPEARPKSILAGLRYGFLALPRDIAVALLIGVVIAGAMAAFVPQDSLRPYIGGGIVSILLLMAAGTPIYVCATASVPIAAGFIHMGASPGAALAFLIAGPATNAATFTTLWRILGRRSAALYMLTIAISAVVFGLLLDEIMALTGAAIPHLGEHQHHHESPSPWSHGWAIALLATLVVSTIAGRRGRIGAASRLKEEPGVAGAGQKVVLAVTGMTCGHCAATVRGALAAAPGVTSAEVDLAAGRAIISGGPLDPQLLASTLGSLGYEARVLDGGWRCADPGLSDGGGA